MIGQQDVRRTYRCLTGRLLTAALQDLGHCPAAGSILFESVQNIVAPAQQMHVA
jgi:hypothetical protein